MSCRNSGSALYEYLFGALLGAELTQKQGVIFRNLARLLMTVPSATIRTLMGFMEDPQTTRPYLSRLDPTSQHFFQTQFFSKAFDNTRQQILTRLWGIQSLFNQARKYKVGLIIAHQNLDQFDQKLRATVLSSTSIKLVGGVSAKDAGVFAKEMNCRSGKHGAGADVQQ